MKFQIKNCWSGVVIFECELSADIENASYAVKLGFAVKAAREARADLSGADLSGADLDPIRNDLWAVLSSAPAEVPGLLAAIRERKIDGSTYEGDCACLVGTIANVRHCRPDDLGVLMPDSSRPAEMLFLAIKPGDTPDTNPTSKIVEEWVSQWLDRMRGAFAEPTAAATTTEA